MDISPISPSSFYSHSSKLRKRLGENTSDSTSYVPYKMSRLVDGPSLTWKIFRKQADALHFASTYKQQLMAYAFETDQTRLFLVAHPEVFWHYDSQKHPSMRSSYEIIMENTACKLYFDIEFNKFLNSSKDGYKLVKIFITLVIFFLKLKLQIECSMEHILNLDSSTDEKFSCHLIFNIPGVCFGNNKLAGNFVAYICNEVAHVTESKNLPAGLEGVSVENCTDLFVEDHKGKVAIFCDQSVYSRNRHFRLYMSSKKGKGVPLVISQINNFNPLIKSGNYDKEIFLSSLITFFPCDLEKFRVINYEYSSSKQYNLTRKTDKYIQKTINNEKEGNPFVKIDQFISKLVSPGKIFRCCYFSLNNVINYDIVGNRYCGNIGRAHKSNNVKYIVDLTEGVFYQKCHDLECSGYKSDKKPLPMEVITIDETGVQDNLGIFGISHMESPRSISLKRFPSCGLADEEINNHLSTLEEANV